MTHHDLDQMLVDQQYRCAVSGIALEAPSGTIGPFGPSIDRIIPALGYVPGNIRIVCVMVNFAMNRWGEEPFRRLMRACRKLRKLREHEENKPRRRLGISASKSRYEVSSG